jgi:2-polyprenyl-3-methyl-5-hydroxy-6-metoxy-1,4-benzoquinol methylase
MYSADAERRYYAQAKEDRRAVPFDHLGDYVAGAVGLDVFRNKDVLDLGAGEGTYSAWIATRGGAKSVVGLELTEHRLRTEFQKQIDNLRLESGDFLSMQPRREQFDVVFMNLVLHHVRFRLADALRYVHETLRPGGRFLAFEPNVYSPAAIVAHLIHHRSANEGFLSPRTIRGAMTGVGFRDINFGFFWRGRRWAKNPLLGSSFWITGFK